ncbi:hydrogenase/urease maturation nickel metallochaperone HypA, partial [Escherichia coli]
MHELSLCQSAVEIIQRQAEQHDVKRVTAVWLEIGALSCVEAVSYTHLTLPTNS